MPIKRNLKYWGSTVDLDMQYNYSVIIPYRDKYDLLLKAVESVADRSDIQIIIVDNGEQPLSDGHIPAKSYAHIDYLTSSPTKGAGCARNVGLGFVKGKYILFLDADDYFTPTAFESFDKYLDKGFDIVYFKSDSVSIKDGSRGKRHEVINNLISSYSKTGKDDILRYRFVNPVAKMMDSDFVLKSGVVFDEIPVSNDVWFSVLTGYHAKNVAADEDVVYVITVADRGGSLTRSLTKENWFIRFQVMVKVNQFLRSIGKYEYRIRLLGGLRIALKEFGIKELWRFYRYARNNKVGIF